MVMQGLVLLSEQGMIAGSFKVPKEKTVANDSNIDPFLQPKAQNVKEAALEDEKRVITEMPEELDNNFSQGDEDHEDL
eukprot:11256972-Ditylum_brightwellii.AAC.1